MREDPSIPVINFNGKTNRKRTKLMHTVTKLSKSRRHLQPIKFNADTLHPSQQENPLRRPIKSTRLDLGIRQELVIRIAWA